MKTLILFAFSLFLQISCMHAQIKFNAPETKKIPVTNEVHGFKITDLYQWLEDKDNPEVKEWSHKQHDYTVSFINQTCPQIAGLKDEIRAYLDRDIIGAPFFKANREFFYAKKKGEPQSKLYTRIKGKEICIFDPVKIDPSGKTSISGFVLTEDGNRAAVGTQFRGDEITDYRIIDTKTGKELYAVMKSVASFNWTKSEISAYITIRTRESIDKQLPLETYLHKIGDDMKNDKLLFAPRDPMISASIWDSEEGNLTFYREGDFYSTTLKYKKTNSLDELKEIYSSKKFTVSPFVKNGKIYFFTNHDAPNFKLMVTDTNHPEFENWKEFYPEKKESVLESYVITKDYVIIQYKKDVISALAVYDLNGKYIRELELPEFADVAGMSYHKQSNIVYVSLSTFTSASKQYKLDGTKLSWEFFYQDIPPIDTKDIESKMVFYPSKDGTKIPMFIVSKKGVKLDGTNPTILYGYGGFNIAMGPGFIGTTASFINRGGVYAVACLRGGNEYGEKWHQEGMLFKKQNTFDDFIAAAEYLIAEKYTNPEKLAIKGGSNGGLLVGATVTQRPELFRAAICAVPLLDMIRYHKFLIARFWIPEYGDPDVKEDFLNIMKYSPYHNIRYGLNLPATMVKAGENDTRVDPLHAKKFAAALQNNPGQLNPIMLFVDFESGHGSGQSVEQQINNIELEWRWVMNQLGIK